jgi:hypothetical protein
MGRPPFETRAKRRAPQDEDGLAVLRGVVMPGLVLGVARMQLALVEIRRSLPGQARQADKPAKPQPLLNFLKLSAELLLGVFGNLVEQVP